MRFYSTAFFADKSEEAPLAHLHMYSEDSFTPVCVQIGKAGNAITIHMTEINFIAFKNSVLSTHAAWDKARKDRANETS